MYKVDSDGIAVLHRFAIFLLISFWFCLFVLFFFLVSWPCVYAVITFSLSSFLSFACFNGSSVVSCLPFLESLLSDAVALS